MSRIRTNIITNRMANGAPTVSNGLVISGVTTTSEILVGNTIKLDPVSGIATARAVDIDDFLDIGNNIKLGNAGVITATSFSGSGANLTNLPPSAPVGGASTNTVFFENDKEVAVNYQITSTKNAMSAGPIAINAGIAVTVPTGCSWTIV